MKMYGFGDVVERSGLRKLASDLDLNATIFLPCRGAPVGFAAQRMVIEKPAPTFTSDSQRLRN